MKVGRTDTEKASILSFHYVGKIVGNNKAQGTLHCFVDGKTLFSGEWLLTKVKDEPGRAPAGSK